MRSSHAWRQHRAHGAHGAHGAHRAHREQGQNQLEYIGLVVLVAAIVVGIASSSVGGKLVGAFEGAVCRVVNPDSKKCASGPDPAALHQTPLEKATSGNYVALGDSYSSGEGGSEFEPGTDEDPSLTDSVKEGVDDWIPGYDHTDPPTNLCHRSTKAYSQRIYDEYDFEGDFDFHACSGATIEDLYNENGDNAGEPPQLDQLDEDTSLVTVSIGGNDVGFADVVKECLTKGVLEFQDGCRETMGEETVEKIHNLKDDLVELYEKMQDRAPNARIVVVGYPRMFPDEPGIPGLEVGPDVGVGDLDEPIEPADQKWMNEMGKLLNQTIKEATQEAGVEYVDVSDALDGHEIGTEDSWINDLNFEWENGKPVDMGSFHPNDKGQAAIAELVQQQIKNGG